jgi:signal peptidase
LLTPGEERRAGPAEAAVDSELAGAREIRLRPIDQEISSLAQALDVLRRSAETEAASILAGARTEAARLRETAQREALEIGAQARARPASVGRASSRAAPGLAGQARKPTSGRWPSRWLAALAAVFVVAVLLVTLGPLVLPYKVLTVKSSSMEPTIPAGSVIFLRPAPPEDVEPGDVITFERPDRPGQLVTHRVVVIVEGSGGRTFITQGDANPAVDGWSVPGTRAGWRYAFHIPYLGYVLAALSSIPGRLALVILPVLAVGLSVLMPLWLPKRQTQARV